MGAYIILLSAIHAYILNVSPFLTPLSLAKPSYRITGVTTRPWCHQLILNQSFGFIMNCLKLFLGQYSITEKPMKTPKIFQSLFLCYSAEEIQILMLMILYRF